MVSSHIQCFHRHDAAVVAVENLAARFVRLKIVGGIIEAAIGQVDAANERDLAVNDHLLLVVAEVAVVDCGMDLASSTWHHGLWR